MGKLGCVLVLLVMLAVPCLAQEGHEVEVAWGAVGASMGDEARDAGVHQTKRAFEVAWRPPLGKGWRFEVTGGGEAGLSGGSQYPWSLDATWLQAGVVTPPATTGRNSLRAFARIGFTVLEESYDSWGSSRDTVASAALGARVDVAVSRRWALGFRVALLKHGSSNEVDTPNLLWLGLGLSATL